jgi:hypothetical protein
MATKQRKWHLLVKIMEGLLVFIKDFLSIEPFSQKSNHHVSTGTLHYVKKSPLNRIKKL